MAHKTPTPFRRPTDVTAWWCAPHCGPGTTDTAEDCGFCGRPVLECAAEHTKAIKDTPTHLGFVDDALGCGGSGFWCVACGRFWAQDVCGEAWGPGYNAADGANLAYDEDQGLVSCCCGNPLFAWDPNDPNGD